MDCWSVSCIATSVYTHNILLATEANDVQLLERFCKVTNPLGDSTSHRAHNPRTTCRSYLGKALPCTPAVDEWATGLAWFGHGLWLCRTTEAESHMADASNLESTWYCFHTLDLLFDTCGSVLPQPTSSAKPSFLITHISCKLSRVLQEGV